MDHLRFLPESSSYSATHGFGLLSTDVDGGMPRNRLDQVNAPHTVNVLWKLDVEEYEELAFFFRRTVRGGALPFTMDLIIDRGGLTRYECQLIPASFRLTEARGHGRIVQAQVYCLSVDDTVGIDESIEVLGGVRAARQIIVAVERLVNIVMPEEIGG